MTSAMWLAKGMEIGNSLPMWLAQGMEIGMTLAIRVVTNMELGMSPDDLANVACQGYGVPEDFGKIVY